MKRICFLSFFLILFKVSSACSCGSFQSFCNSHTNYDLTANCVIVDTFPNGISMKVLYVWNGNENRDTINVWNIGGPYDMCNDSATDASAAFLGSVGDTLILALPKIDTIKKRMGCNWRLQNTGFSM